MTAIDSQKINLTGPALLQAIHLKETTSEFSGKDLRLYLEGKGCDGFYYGVTFDDATPEDLRFPQTLEGQVEASVVVIVDPDTMQFVDGSVIEWVDDERGRGFLVENPGQKQFRGKFFKRSSWREKLEASKDSKGL